MSSVGFIGLGTMGMPMARNILAAGFELSVYGRDQAKCLQLVDAGARLRIALGDFRETDVLVTMVTGDDALVELFFDRGLLEILPPGAIHLSCSTISTDMATRLDKAHAERGQGFVAAPVVGRSDRAAARTLGVIMAGAPAHKQRCRPIMEATSSRIFDFGESPESAIAVKIANNFMIGACIELLSEAFSVTDGHGVLRQDFLEFITSSLFAAPVFGIYGDLMLREAFVPAGSPIPIGVKDMRLAQRAAESAGVAIPLADVVMQHLDHAVARGLRDHDWAVLGSRHMAWTRDDAAKR